MVFFAITRIMGSLPGSLRAVAIIVAFIALFIPIGLLTIIAITFGFEAVLNVFVDADLNRFLVFVGLGYIGAILTLWLDRRLDEAHTIRILSYARRALLALSTLGFFVLIFMGGSQVVGSKGFAELSMRDLGVSGIGTAPAIIALTLYSLLPLVRNTYAGLRNVDPAVIDSGRGMGMTPSQIFFQIELPLAFPIIMAGVRNAGISLVGIAAVASIIGAGALGDFILLGVNSTSIDLILLGALPAIILAVLLDGLMQFLEELFTSPGISRASN